MKLPELAILSAALYLLWSEPTPAKTFIGVPLLMAACAALWVSAAVHG